MLSTADEYKRALESPRVVIRFTADWCGPCKRFAPTYDKLASKFLSVSFHTIDIDNKSLKRAVTENKVRAVPYFAFYRNGTLVDHCMGAHADVVEEKLATLSRV